MKVAIFSKYANYLAGGAEKSIGKVILEKKTKGSSVSVYSFYIKESGLEPNPVLTEVGLSPEYYVPKYNFKKFFFWEYVFNKRSLTKFIQVGLNADEIITYGIYSPVVVNSTNTNCSIYIRSETDLGIRSNSYTGFKKFLKYVYLAIEWPAYLVYKSDLKNSLAKAKVISNSHYMSGELFKLFGIPSQVSYPYVDVEKLKLQYMQVKKSFVGEEGIVFVGDSDNKGLRLFFELSKLFPKERFYLFSRKYINVEKHNNVTRKAWEKDTVNLYKVARLVIVPSQWVEAYGRVAREAFVLNIPVLVSGVGGLPEAVDYDGSKVVQDYSDVSAWFESMERVL